MSFLQERDLVEWGRRAREWLTHDARGRVVGLVILSVTISIAMSLAATAIVGVVSRRRAVGPIDALPPDVGEPTGSGVAAPGESVSDAEEGAGVPSMGTELSIAEDGPAQAAGA
jgi:hypothetical protein